MSEANIKVDKRVL